MKQIVRYRTTTIPNKLIGEFRLTIDDGRSSPEYSSLFDGGRSTNVALFPVLSLNILRPTEIDEIGNRVRAPWNINDSITMTKFTIPIFTNEIETLYEEIKTPEMYTYHGDRLELNEKLANKVRHVFKIGSTTLELIPVVIDDEGNLMEGIKMKFNNESSSVLLTINELISLIYAMKTVDMDNIALHMYLNYMRNNDKSNIRDNASSRQQPKVDIKPISKNNQSEEKKDEFNIKNELSIDLDTAKTE